MRVIRTVEELRESLGGRRPALIPTMGALHAGHGALIRRAVELATDRQPVVVSIFVNPTQFGPGEDFSKYPRMIEQDANAVALAGGDVVFAPDGDVMYPGGVSCTAVPALPPVATRPGLEDAHRPTHFAGVCQVVARLFDLIQPSFAVFGEKDYQQLRVVEDMVAQEGQRWSGLRIQAHPTVREHDGLAMSSRNAYLTPEHRDRALGLSCALDAIRSDNGAGAENLMRQVLERHGLRIDYAVVRDARSLMPASSPGAPLRALIAARIGNVRLIDNKHFGG